MWVSTEEWQRTLIGPNAEYAGKKVRENEKKSVTESEVLKKKHSNTCRLPQQCHCTVSLKGQFISLIPRETVFSVLSLHEVEVLFGVLNLAP
mmetsp:Transcript_22895/g.67594  ORF Transcript_22895/g.67594 Transcript_22895/m.67594 type:complete len:92 (+) Transcript_22895:862-1137(+)